MTIAVDPPRKFWEPGPGELHVGFTESKITKVLARGNRQVPEVAYPAAHLLEGHGLAGLRIGYGFCAAVLARRLWTMQPPLGIGIASLVAVAASYDAENQLRQRIQMISSERRYLRMRLRSMGAYSTDSHANFVYPPPWRQPWREVFDGTGLQVRN